MSSPPQCPSCQTVLLRRHCDSPRSRCRWLACPKCHSYGVPGRRWYDTGGKKIV